VSTNCTGLVVHAVPLQRMICEVITVVSIVHMIKILVERNLGRTSILCSCDLLLSSTYRNSVVLKHKSATHGHNVDMTTIIL
jgi:hypothetical protein